MKYGPIIAALAFLCCNAAAQEPEPTRVKYEDLPPSAQLGVRTSLIQKSWPSLPIVVIVPDAASYIGAISHWSLVVRYPVLIDDGSPAASEDIARFVRDFAPSKIVRWSLKNGPTGRAAVESAMRQVWSGQTTRDTEPPVLKSSADLIARWKHLNVPRTGIVFTAEGDHAWPAALALAAGRGQPLAWIERHGAVDTTMGAEAFRALEAAVEAGCESTGLTWTATGDDIDAVTLCMQVPIRVQADRSLVLAVTDALARPLATEAVQIGSQERWAWSGHIFGSESRSAYAAICSLFLAPKRAWLFDGYKETKPWSDFDATPAAAILKQVKIEATLDDAPRSGEVPWRTRAAQSINAGFITVNTHGQANEFNLEPGRCTPGDLPFLTVPAAVYFVHSWSAVTPGDRNTVAGRWLERGVYTYLGSVDEPYLQAFAPTPTAVGRLASSLPWAAAVRSDRGAAWKLATIGDPLTLLLNPVPRKDGELPLDGATELQSDLHRALDDKDFAGAIRILSMWGRDDDAAALIKGLLKEDPASITPACARNAVLPLFRAGEIQPMFRVFGLLPQKEASDPVLRDALWLASYRVLPSTTDATLVSALRLAVREDQRYRDTMDLLEPTLRIFGRDAAGGFLEESRARITDPGQQRLLDNEARRLNVLRLPR